MECHFQVVQFFDMTSVCHTSRLSQFQMVSVPGSLLPFVMGCRMLWRGHISCEFLIRRRLFATVIKRRRNQIKPKRETLIMCHLGK